MRQEKAGAGAGMSVGVLAVLAAGIIPALVAPSHQYTWSLLLFAVPVVAMVRWLKAHAEDRPQLRRSLTVATAALTPTGFVLNLCFADAFFVWPNEQAVLGLTIPSFGLSGATVAIPVEEFLFYSLGFTAVLLGYVWSERALFPHLQRGEALAPRIPWNAVLVVAAVCVGGVLLQRALNPGAKLPGYLLYLAVVPLLGTLLQYPRVRQRVNAAALTFTLMATLAISITWEVALAIPRGWWGYRPESMVGLRISSWSNLPVEAVAVWVLVVFASAVTWETLRLKAPARVPARPRRTITLEELPLM
jgi:hypothetical protein